MNKLFLACVLFFTLILSALPSVTLEQLSWLEGQWRGTAGKNRFEARYGSAEGGVLLSMNKEFKPDGRLTFYEIERFMMNEGILQMTPFVNGKELSTFKLTAHDMPNYWMRFENKKNDFPSQISYHRKTPDRLVIILTGKSKEKSLKVVYDLKRVKN